MNAATTLWTAVLVVAAAGVSAQDGGEWRDTHRVQLRNGNTVEGRLENSSDPTFIVLSYSQGIRVAIKAVDVVRIEVLTIRPSGSQARRVDGPPPPRPEEVKPPPPPPKEPEKKPLDEEVVRLLVHPSRHAADLVARLEGLAEEHRRRVVSALRDVLPEERIEPSLRKGLQSAHPDVREAMTRMLTSRKDEASLAALHPLMKDKAPAVRVAAAEALGILGNEEHLKALADGSVDPAAAVRPPSIEAAKGIATRVAAWETLAQMWIERLRGASDAARGNLAMALAGIASKASPEIGEETRRVLSEYLVDRSREVRLRAIIGMAELKDERTAELIRSHLDGEMAPELQAEMCTTLSKIGISNSAIVGSLIDLLLSRAAPVRVEAERALKKLTGQFGFDSDYETWADWYNRSK